MAENPKQPPRRPGSQVAPGQRPLFRPGTTASTHSRIPLDQATAGKLYRVRDKADAQGNCIIWGENLTFEEANKLKEKTVGARKSRTARVEEMPEEDLEQPAESEGDFLTDSDQAINSVLAEEPSALPPAPTPVARSVPAPRPPIAPAAPVKQVVPTRVSAPAPSYNLDSSVDYTKLPETEMFRALGNDPRRWARAFWQHATAQGIKLSRNDEGFILGWFQQAIEVKKASAPAPTATTPHPASAAAAGEAARQAQIRADQLKKKPTPVVQSAPPTPPPSPLTDELVELEGDGPAELPPDDQLLDNADISDLSAEVGGGPSDADKQRAKAKADADVAEMSRAARSAYQDAVQASPDTGWPAWEQLGEYEHAAWRYFVAQGGDQPELVKAARKVAHAMGQVPS